MNPPRDYPDGAYVFDEDDVPCPQCKGGEDPGDEPCGLCDGDGFVHRDVVSPERR